MKNKAASNTKVSIKSAVFAISMAVIMGFVTALALCVQALRAPQAVFSAADAGMRVVVDAGHGGIDGGVVGRKTGVKESDLNLSISRKTTLVLEDMGFAVTQTRKTEAGLYGTAAKGFKKRDMQKRKEIIAEADPALLLSVHQNFYPTQMTRGAQVFYAKKDENSKRLALCLQAKLNGLYAEEGVKARTAKTGEFFMLTCADCPSVIVECGFLSNVADEKLLCSDVWQRRLAEAIAGGVIAYLSDSIA